MKFKSAKRGARLTSKQGKKMTARGIATKHEGIWKKGDDKFTVLATARVNDKRVYRQVVVVGTEVDARDRQLQLVKELAEAKTLTNVSGTKNDSVAALASAWLDHLENKIKTTRGTLLRHQQNVVRFIVPYFDTKTLKQLTRLDLVRFMEWLPTQRAKNGEQYALASLHNVWRSTGMFFRYCSLHTNTSSLVAELRFNIKDGKDVKEKQPLTQHELMAFLAGLEGEPHRYRIPLWISGSTGCRIGEATGLHWEDCDFTNCVITFRRSNSAGVVNNKTKTKVIRKVPMDERVMAMLMAIKPDDASGLIFRNTVGGLLTPAVFREPIARACKLAGITSHVSPHILRRSVNNYLRTATDDIKQVMDIIGHSTSEMNLLYSKVAMEEKRALLTKMMYPPVVSQPG